MLSMHPQTLRKYERLGLVQPARTIGSMRLYSEAEIERLRLIKRLVDDAGVNLAGVQRLLSVAEGLQRMQPLLSERRSDAPRPSAGWRAKSAGSNRSWGCDDGLQRLLHDARRGQDRHREGDQAGLSQAGAQAPSRRQPRRPRGRDELQGGQRGLRGAEQRRDAPQVRRTRRQLAPVRAGGPRCGRSGGGRREAARAGTAR